MNTHPRVVCLLPEKHGAFLGCETEMTSAADLIRQINEIKSQLSSQDILKPAAWQQRQRLQSLCQKVLVLNLEFALDQKIEQDLWNYAFKMQITSLQAVAKDKQAGTSIKVEHHADLEQFLESSIGYYSQLLQEMCDVFRLHPPFRKKQHYYGILQERNSACYKPNFKMPSKLSSKYICQYCLVHLGDLARYLQRVPLAESFYQSAAQYAPSNGQPYNQLAILNASRGEKLAVVFYYVRSIAVKSPFPVASTNLEKMYFRISKEAETMSFPSKAKWTAEDVEMAFLGLHALLHVEAGVERCQKMAEQVTKCLTSASLFQLISDHSLIHMMAVGLFGLHRIEQTEKCDDVSDLTPMEREYANIRLSFLASYLDVLLLHATKTDASDPSEHRVLPAVKLLLDWLVVADNGKRLRRQQFRMQSIWMNLCKVLNALQQSEITDINDDVEQYESQPLPEDFELQCFLPLQACHKELDFVTNSATALNEDLQNTLRNHRLTVLGRSIRDHFANLRLVDYTVHPKTRKLTFTSPLALVDSLAKRAGRQNVAMQAIMQKPSNGNAAGDVLIPPDNNGIWSLWGQQSSSQPHLSTTMRSSLLDTAQPSSLPPEKPSITSQQLPIGYGANRSSKTVSPDFTRSSSPSLQSHRVIDSMSPAMGLTTFGTTSEAVIRHSSGSSLTTSSLEATQESSLGSYSLFSHSPWDINISSSVGSNAFRGNSAQAVLGNTLQAAGTVGGMSAVSAGGAGNNTLRATSDLLGVQQQAAWGSSNFVPALHSLWSAEPSPLERLLEQQKLQKPAPNGDST